MQPTEKVKDKLSIVDVVSSYIKLEKSGAQYKARCPFHNEKTPSFYVSPTRNTFHCFGCNKGGDIFKFIEEIEHIPFKESLKLLADRAGVSLAAENKEKTNTNNNLLSILAASKHHYIKNLSESSEAQVYLKERGLTQESISQYSIGFAKPEWRDLFIALKMQGYQEDDMVLAGVIIKTEDGKYYDRFRGRIMFPINNISAATVGFTGRVLPRLDDGKSGKYVNTPETTLYHKSEILFNYDKAKSYMKDSGEVVLVEGQMDVIMSNQSGVHNVLAVSGTAFTDQHVHMIKRLCDRVIIAFDNDKAGEAARLRAISMCIAGDLEVYTINNDGGKDAADIVKEDSNLWLNLISNKILIWDYLSDAALGVTDLRARVRFTRDHIIHSINFITSQLYKTEIIKHVAKKLSLKQEDLISELEKIVPERNVLTYQEKASTKKSEPSTKKEVALLALSKILNKSVKDDFELTYNSRLNDIKSNSKMPLDFLNVNAVIPSLLYEKHFESIEYPEDIINREMMKLESEGGDYDTRYVEGLVTLLKDILSKEIESMTNSLQTLELEEQNRVLSKIMLYKKLMDKK